MRKLRRTVGGSKGGRCGMVVPNGVLFGDGVCARIKEELPKVFIRHALDQHHLAQQARRNK